MLGKKTLNIIIFVIFLASDVMSQTSTNIKIFEFIRMENRTGVGFPQLVNPLDSWTASSRIMCVRYCLRMGKMCKVVEFDGQSGNCTAGTSVIQNGTIPTQTVFYSKLKTCDPDQGYSYKTYNGDTVCMYVSDESMTHLDAIKRCREDGAILYTVKTMEKYEMLRLNRKGNSDSVWVGLYDVTGNNDFYWSDGEPFEASSDIWNNVWSADQPDANAGQHCVASFKSVIRFFDVRCENVYRYACEINEVGGHYFDP